MTVHTIETNADSQPTPSVLDGPKAKGVRQALRILRLILQPTKYMDDSVKRYGPMFQIGGDSSPPLVYVGDPAVVKEIFSLDDDKVITGQGNGVLATMVGQQSILLLDGPAHKRKRKLLMPPFHGEQLRTYGQLICDITRDVSANWQPGQTIVARAPIQSITLGIIIQAVFGQQKGDAQSERLARLQRLMSTLLDSFAYPITASFLFFPKLQKDWGSWSPWGKFVQMRENVRSLIYAEIRDRRTLLERSAREQDKPTDILTLLLQATDDSGRPMSDEELHDEIVTLLLAGHETTASGIVWTLYWVHHQPEVHQKLRAELDTLGLNPSPIAITQLPYLTAVCQEALRIYPITPTTFIRRLREPMTLATYHFEAGTALMPATYIIHQRPDLYPEPRQFRPERFLEKQFAPYEFLPFGGGHRYCIGSALAMMELKLSVATLLTEFKLSLPHARPLLPARRGLTMAPPASMKLKIEARRTA